MAQIGIHSGHLCFGPAGAGAVLARDANQLPIGRNVHIAGVYKNGKTKLFVDGKLAAETVSTTPLPAAKIVHVVGGGFVGELDEIRFSNKARYQSAFAPPGEAQQFVTDDSTIALFHLDTGSGEVLKDASGNRREGTFNGPKWRSKIEVERMEKKSANANKNPEDSNFERDLAKRLLEMKASLTVRVDGIDHFIKPRKQDIPPGDDFQIVAVYTARDQELNSEIVQQLAQCQSLEVLTAYACPVTDDDVRLLSKLKLKELVIGDSQVTDACISFVLEMTSLTQLDISENNISDGELTRLAMLKNLQQLSVGRESLTKRETIQELAEGLPNCEIKSPFGTFNSPTQSENAGKLSKP